MATRELVIDACCLLSLLATGRAVDIVGALGIRLLDTPYVAREPLFLWSPPNEEGERSKEAVSTDALRAAGHLVTRPLDTDALVDAFVVAAARIKDADASCVALAGVLRCPLITNDRKERQIAASLFPGIEIVSTLDLCNPSTVGVTWA